jgi:hypothetical protein
MDTHAHNARKPTPAQARTQTHTSARPRAHTRARTHTDRLTHGRVLSARTCACISHVAKRHRVHMKCHVAGRCGVACFCAKSLVPYPNLAVSAETGQCRPTALTRSTGLTRAAHRVRTCRCVCARRILCSGSACVAARPAVRSGAVVAHVVQALAVRVDRKVRHELCAERALTKSAAFNRKC